MNRKYEGESGPCIKQADQIGMRSMQRFLIWVAILLCCWLPDLIVNYFHLEHLFTFSCAKNEDNHEVWSGIRLSCSKQEACDDIFSINKNLESTPPMTNLKELRKCCPRNDSIITQSHTQPIRALVGRTVPLLAHGYGMSWHVTAIPE